MATAMDTPVRFVISFLESSKRFEYSDKGAAVTRAIELKKAARMSDRVWITFEYADGDEWTREIVMNAIGTGYEFG